MRALKIIGGQLKANWAVTSYGLKMGCRVSIIQFISSFLSNWWHWVAYMGEIMDFAPITCRVLQGTIVEPVVFQAITNSLCQEVLRRASKIRRWFVAANIITTINEIDGIVFTHRSYTQCKKNWTISQPATECKDKEMYMNASPCNALFMILVLRPLVLADLQVDNHPLPVVSEI